jgi:hypothetical protein
MTFHLIYVSTALRRFSPESLEELLAQSRAANRVAGISGLLVYGGGNFMQLLEGPRDAVETTYARILRDRRHVDMTLLFQTETPERWCGDWAMAYAANAGKKDIAGFVNLIETGGQVLTDLADDHLARRIMNGFIDGNR